jgi:hypothetical protein
MRQKQKRSDGGIWEYSAWFADLEQRARIAADVYEAIMDDIVSSAVTAQLVDSQSPPPGKPTYENLINAQQYVREALIVVLNGVGMESDAALIAQMVKRVILTERDHDG